MQQDWWVWYREHSKPSGNFLFLNILHFFLLISKRSEEGGLGPDHGGLCGFMCAGNRARSMTSFLTTDLHAKRQASGKAGGRLLAELWPETLRAWNRQWDSKSQKRGKLVERIGCGKVKEPQPSFKFCYSKLYILIDTFWVIGDTGIWDIWNKFAERRVLF